MFVIICIYQIMKLFLCYSQPHDYWQIGLVGYSSDFFFSISSDKVQIQKTIVGCFAVFNKWLYSIQFTEVTISLKLFEYIYLWSLYVPVDNVNKQKRKKKLTSVLLYIRYSCCEKQKTVSLNLLRTRCCPMESSGGAVRILF